MKEQKPVKNHNYSYIDVLERVADGVHVEVVSRKPAKASRESNRGLRSEDSQKPPSSKR